MDINNYKNRLRGKVVLITGAGGGIGYETAKCFSVMGAKVIIAEIDKEKGLRAQKSINEINHDSAEFYPIDLAEEQQITEMKNYILNKYGCPDVVFNNATYVSLGEINLVGSQNWDKSYLVNLKAPILLVHAFLKGMKERNAGIFVFVSSSGASPYMGAYEIFKTSQVELSNTLAMELENTNVYAYTIGPGLVKTETAMKAIEVVAENMDMTTEQFYQLNEHHVIGVEDAALGFALSVLDAEKYNGQEIGSIQVLNAADNDQRDAKICLNRNLLEKVFVTYEEQFHGWKKMNIFEKQWVLRDFKKSMGISIDETYQRLKDIRESDKDFLTETEIDLLQQLKNYWQHQYDLLQGYEKNKDKLKENGGIVQSWINDIDTLTAVK